MQTNRTPAAGGFRLRPRCGRRECSGGSRLRVRSATGASPAAAPALRCGRRTAGFEIKNRRQLIFGCLRFQERGLKRIRTAVQGFADLCLATRPSDQILGSRYCDDASCASLRRILAESRRRTGPVSRLQIYKHFSFLQNLSKNFRFSTKKPYLYLTKIAL